WSSRMAFTFSSTRAVCARMSPGTRLPVAGSIGICPAQKSRSPTRTAWLYGPTAAADPAGLIMLLLSILVECYRRTVVLQLWTIYAHHRDRHGQRSPRSQHEPSTRTGRGCFGPGRASRWRRLHPEAHARPRQPQRSLARLGPETRARG